MTNVSDRTTKLLDLLQSLQLRINTAKHYQPSPLDSELFKTTYNDLAVALDGLLVTATDEQIQAVIGKINTVIQVTYAREIGDLACTKIDFIRRVKKEAGGELYEYVRDFRKTYQGNTPISWDHPETITGINSFLQRIKKLGSQLFGELGTAELGRRLQSKPESALEIALDNVAIRIIDGSYSADDGILSVTFEPYGIHGSSFDPDNVSLSARMLLLNKFDKQGRQVIKDILTFDVVSKEPE